MPSDLDASIKLLYPVDLNQFFTIDDVASGDSFDVISDYTLARSAPVIVCR